MLTENGAASPGGKEIPYRVVEADFVLSAPHFRLCPTSELPEFAVAGRSNVGKSSLINLFCNRKNLAKTSTTPGKTRLLNYFLLRIEPGNHRLHLVDLPGYGYASAGKEDQAQWGKMIEEFMRNRSKLSGILHLIDARHPDSDLDLRMREWIVHQQVPAITVLTKIDKLPKNAVRSLRKQVAQSLHLGEEEPCILSSVLQRLGIDEILHSMIALMPSA